MYGLKVSVAKIHGVCDADPPMAPGQYFTVSNGDIRIPEGSHVCAWALHSLLPVITPRERQILESEADDLMSRVRQVQCPDPDGRVVFEIERMGTPQRRSGPTVQVTPPQTLESMEGDLWNLRVVVEEVRGKCSSGMKPGDYFILRRGRLYIPADRHFCLYALQAAFPFLPAKQRPLPEGDWLNRANFIICPDPEGSVIMRVERAGTN
jgi:uncharacterized repeat protein (TIGR04076 family)